MEALTLAVNPLAKLLAGLAERRATGSLSYGGRTLVVANAELCDVTAGPNDADLGAFLIASGRASSAAVDKARKLAAERGISLEDALAEGGHGRAELRAQKRALWLDRWVRALRLGQEQKAQPPALEPRQVAADGGGVPLLPFVLDSFARLAVDTDATVVGMNINHRLTWIEGPLREEAQRWAALGNTVDRPVISTVLARVPAVAPQIAALVRVGLLRLDPPGSPGARMKSKTGTLPPPPPRLSILPPAPKHASVRSPPPSIRPPAAPGRAPKLRLDPGADGIPVESIPPIALPSPAGPSLTLVDPLREIELRIAALEANQASGLERARAFVELSRLWQSRIGSLEEATRALREAAAADPSDARLLSEAALHCSYLGRVDLGIAYAQAARAASPISIERAAASRLLAEIYRAADNVEACIDALSEAAAEDESSPEAHELLAHLLAERDNLPLAVAHARFAAQGWAEHDQRRAAMLYAMAYGWNPSDPALSEEYAGVLAALGHGEAAVAILAETARNLDGTAARRKVRFAAAQRADAAGRKDLAVELMIEQLDDEPEHELLHAPLDEDLAGLGDVTEHAALLESIADACVPAQRATWLARAGEVLAKAPGQRETALRFFARAQAADPSSARLREVLARASVSADELARLAASDDAAIATLEAKLQSTRSEAEERMLLDALMDARASRRDYRGMASAALRLLALDAKHTLAAARLWRASARLGDPVLLREALTLRARAKPGTRERGRALAALCRQLENMGDYDAAIASAEAALSADPSAADAAIVVLRHSHRLEAGRAAELLGRARTLLGDSPPLLFALAQAALAAGDNATHIATLREFCELSPLMPDGRLAALAFDIAQHDAVAILEDAEALLRDAGGPVVVARVKEASDTLAELGAHADAARLAQRALDERGQIDASYALRALSLAQASGDPSLVTVALERCVSAETGEERLTRLIDLADHHQSLGDHVAELRALLRVLAMDASNARALAGLADLFRRSGDTQRLLTVLTLELDSTIDPRARREKLLELAARAADGGSDEARLQAADYLGALMIESVDERAALLQALGALFALGDVRWAIDQARRLARALPGDAGGIVHLWMAREAEVRLHDAKLALELASEGAREYPMVGELLLMVERLTLAAKDRDSALGLYDELVSSAIGPHGRRALHYRAGRWLERAGSPHDALEHYLRAFSLAKGAGVAYKAIERVARGTGQLGALLDVQEELAATFRDADARLSLLQTSAKLALTDLDDPARGFRLLMKADELADIGLLGDALVDAAHRIGVRDPAGEAQALGAIAASWEERAHKYWDADTKARLFVHAARVHMNERSDTQASLRALDQALTSEVAPNLSQEVHAATLCAYAETLARVGRENEARDAVQRALASSPDNAQARELERRWGAPVPAADAPPAAASPAPIASEAEADPEISFASEPPPAVEVSSAPPPPQPEDRDEASLPGPGSSAPPPSFELAPPAAPAIEAARAPAPAIEIPPPPPAAPPPRVELAPLRDPVPPPAPRGSETMPEMPRPSISIEAAARTSAISLDATTPDFSVSALLEERKAAPAAGVKGATSLEATTPGLGAAEPAAPAPQPTAATPELPSSIADAISASSASQQLAAPTAAAAEPRTTAPTPEPRRPRPTPRVLTQPLRGAAPTPRPDTSPIEKETRLRARAEAGDATALDELISLLSVEPARKPEAHYLLGKLVRSSPARIDALRRLHSESNALGAQAEAAVSAEILSLFDPTVTAPRRRAFHSGLLHGESIFRVVDAEIPPDVRRLLGLLWENTRGIPRFRRAIDAYDVTAKQRASLATDVPSALAFAQAARLLQRTETPLYLKPRAQPALTVVPTHPPAIIARIDLGPTPALSYRMAQSLVWADPEHAVVCVLSEQDGRELLAGMLGAFGPKEASAALSRTAKELASTLWHTVPVRSQATMRDIIHAHYAAFDYDTLRRASILASHRAATYVLGDARLALETVAGLETAPALDDVRSEDTYRFACTSSDTFVEVLRTTLSETYLSLVAQTL